MYPNCRSRIQKKDPNMHDWWMDVDWCVPEGGLAAGEEREEKEEEEPDAVEDTEFVL